MYQNCSDLWLTILGFELLPFLCRGVKRNLFFFADLDIPYLTKKKIRGWESHFVCRYGHFIPNWDQRTKDIFPSMYSQKYISTFRMSKSAFSPHDGQWYIVTFWWYPKMGAHHSVPEMFSSLSRKTIGNILRKKLLSRRKCFKVVTWCSDS